MCNNFSDELICRYLTVLRTSVRKRLRTKVRDTGDIDVQDVENIIKKKKKPTVVAITHVPTSSGKVQPVAAIGKLCRQ